MSKQMKYIFLSVIRSIIKFFCYFAIFNIVNILFLTFTEKFNVENRSGWSIAILIFSALSVAWVFYHYNRRAKIHFIESLERTRKKNSPLRALLSLDFLTDTSVCFVLSFVSAFLFGYSDMETLFFGNINLSPIVRKFLIGAFIGFIFFFIEWFTVYDIRKKWQKNKDISSKYEIIIIAAYLCAITVMYTVGFYLAISYLPGLPAYIFLLKELLPYIIIILAVSMVLIYFNRIRKRKNFISKLKKLACESNFTVSNIQKPYLSVFKRTNGISFTITANQKSYDCKLISGKRKNIPIIFTNQGFLLFRRIIRLGKSELFSIYSKYDYQFESDAKKCLIITYIPKNCYFKDFSGRMRKIDTGEKIGEYTVFSAGGFLNALERGCLDR